MRRICSALVLLAALALASCSGLYTNLDGGAGGGTGGDGGGTGGAGGTGGTGGAGGSGGSGGAGGSGGTGGSGGAGGGGGSTVISIVPGDAGSWVATPLTTGLSVPDEYLSIGGTSDTQYWVGDGAGRLLSLNAGTWTVVYTDASNYDLHTLWVSPAGAVFAVADTRLAQCLNNCSQAGTFQVGLTVPVLSHLAAVCGGNGVVYAIEETSGASTVHLFNGATWSSLTTFATPASPQACLVLPDGTLLVSGQDDVYRRFADGGTATEPVPNPTTGASPYWWGLTLYGNEVWAAGQGRRIARRSPSGNWTIVYEGSSDLYRFHGISNAGGVLVTAGDESTVHTRVVVEGNTATLLPGPAAFWGRGTFVTSANAHLVVGFDGPPSNPSGKIYRFSR